MKKETKEIFKRIEEADFYLIVGLTGHKEISKGKESAFSRTFATAEIPSIIGKLQAGELKRALNNLLEKLEERERQEVGDSSQQ